MQNFYSYRLMGSQAEELIKNMLTQSGYFVYDYAYERLLPAICEKYHTDGIKSTSTFLRIRHSPDLLVYDNSSHELLLVEVKMRSVSPDMKICIDNFRMRNYQKYWGDTILVIVTNKEDKIYAQKISNLNSNGVYDLKTDFLKMEDIFFRITKKVISEYKERTGQMMFSNQRKNKKISKTKAYSVSEIRTRYPRAYEKWSKDEDSTLIREFRDGLSRSELASIHKRKKGAITSRLKKLGEISY